MRKAGLFDIHRIVRVDSDGNKTQYTSLDRLEQALKDDFGWNENTCHHYILLVAVGQSTGFGNVHSSVEYWLDTDVPARANKRV